MKMRDETIPDESQLRCLLEGIILPVLNQIAGEIGRRIRTSATIMLGGDPMDSVCLRDAGDDDCPLLEGELRLYCRNAFGGRMVMFCECIFERHPTVHNCSGFSLKAELKENVTKRTAFTMRYSVWDWTGWV
jgi:hypothetical protein